MWVEIFKGGKQTDSAGFEHDGESLIESAVKSFNPQYHEPPVCIGHPADNKPAWGWIAGLKAENGSLFAQLKDVQPEFETMLQRKMFKKRSAAFYPDGSLRHVAFLGAQPPAVKGLADLKYAETEKLITFEEGIMPNGMATPEKPAGDQMPEWASDLIKRVSDIEAAMAKLAPKEKAEDEEKPKEGEPPKDQMFSEADLARARREGEDRAETKAWLKSLKIRPALTSGLAEFMDSDEGKTFAFGEHKGVTAKAFVRQLVDRFSALDIDGHLFSEFAKDGAQKNKSSGIGKEIAAEINRQKGIK